MNVTSIPTAGLADTEPPVTEPHATEPSASLRSVIGLDTTPPRWPDVGALIMIDYQNTYRTGVMALPGAESAVSAATRLLSAARTAGVPVIHIVNDGGEGTPYDIRAEIGAVIPEVAPVPGEPVIVKQAPNAFHQTDLLQTLQSRARRPQTAAPDLVLAGFMTHMCVQFTAEGAFLHGYRPTVVADACATRPLTTPTGTVLPPETLHTAALTTISDLYGLVVPTAESLSPAARR